MQTTIERWQLRKLGFFLCVLKIRRRHLKHRGLEYKLCTNKCQYTIVAQSISIETNHLKVSSASNRSSSKTKESEIKRVQFSKLKYGYLPTHTRFIAHCLLFVQCIKICNTHITYTASSLEVYSFIVVVCI